MDNQASVLQVALSEQGILRLTLDRPTALNALNATLLQQLTEQFLTAKEDAKVKALLITGNGKAFCAGADIKQLATLDAQSGLAFAKQGQEVFRLLETLGKPSLAAINGLALGGGCELAMSATLRIAAESALFAQPEVKLGVIPGFGGTQRLARLVGKGRALDLCLTGRMLLAKEALTWGLVSEVVPAELLISRAEAMLQDLLKLAPIALASTMAVIDRGYDLTLDDALALEASYFALCCATKDKQEGVDAFLTKRNAVFSGA